MSEWREAAKAFDDSVCDAVKHDTRDLIGSTLSRLGFGKGDKRAIDVGCGTGTFAHRHSQRFAQLVAIDFASEMIEIARDRCSGVSNILWWRGSIQQAVVRWPRGFDIVVCINVMTMASPRARRSAWKAIVGLVRSSGCLLAVLPALESEHLVRSLRGGKLVRSHDLSNHGLVLRDGLVQKFYAVDEIAAECAKLGLKLKSIEPLGYEWSLEGSPKPKRVGALRPWDWLCVFDRGV